MYVRVRKGSEVRGSPRFTQFALTLVLQPISVPQNISLTINYYVKCFMCLLKAEALMKESKNYY